MQEGNDSNDFSSSTCACACAPTPTPPYPPTPTPTPSHLVTEELQALSEHTYAILRVKHSRHEGGVPTDAVEHIQHADEQVQMRPVRM